MVGRLHVVLAVVALGVGLLILRVPLCNQVDALQPGLAVDLHELLAQNTSEVVQGLHPAVNRSLDDLHFFVTS